MFMEVAVTVLGRYVLFNNVRVEFCAVRRERTDSCYVATLSAALWVCEDGCGKEGCRRLRAEEDAA